MNVLETMEAHRAGFTPNDELIYQRIIADPESVASLTTVILAEQCGVSQPALTRFVKAIGYARYQDFRTDLVSWLAARESADELSEGRLPGFAVAQQMLMRMEALFTDKYLQDLATYVASFDRVFAVGVTKSRHPAELLDQLTIKTKRHIHAIDFGLLGEYADALGERDLLIVFTLSQRTPNFAYLEGTAGKILLCTATSSGPLSKLADRQIVFPTVTSSPEDSLISPVMFDLFAELLVRYLAKE